MQLGRAAEVFRVFLGLGLTSFGGPVAHLGYFRDAFVVRRPWIDEASYGDLVSLCQFLPGPASSQVGIAIGHRRAGFAGALAAWIGFTAPSVVLLGLFAMGADLWRGAIAEGVLHGLKLAAVAVVAQAVWQMALRLTPDWPRRSLAVAAAALVLFVPLTVMPVLAIAAAAVLGAAMAPAAAPLPLPPMDASHSRGLWLLALFAVLLVGMPLLSALVPNPVLDVVVRFYRTGALVFGGGHVVLPLLQNELVQTGLVDRDLFLAGYGAAQAVPGPLFSFAFYAGEMLKQAPNGIAGGLLALVSIYVPSFLLVLGALPWWERLKTMPRLRAALDMANAAVVGLLLAALVSPVLTSPVFGPVDCVLAAVALAALFLRAPPWLVVIACGAAAGALAAI